MNLRRSSLRGVAASAAALALIVGSGATGAWAQEESPAPEPEATTTSEAPINPLPEPKTARYHAGQSLQIRVNADGTQNSDLINYRWSVNQVTINATSEENGETLVVPMPDRGNLIRYLNNFGHPTVENGVAMLDAPVENNVGLARSVSLWPQDEQPKVSLTTEFWLDGVKQESAQDVVGKDGVLTAQYTVSNLSTSTYTVTVPDLDGNPVEVQQEAQQLYVGIAKTLLPQRYSGLNTPGGMGGADGRGNNQIQWIIVPTMPLNENGVKTFGWSAHVTDAVIPSILLQVQPVYHAAGHAEEDAPGDETGTEEGGSTIPLDPALAEISAGIDNIVSGLDAISASAPADEPCAFNDPVTGAPYADPLQCVSAGLRSLINGLYGYIAGPLVDMLDPNNPESLTTTLNEWGNKLVSGNTEGLYDLLYKITWTDPTPITGIDNWDTFCDAIADAQGPTEQEECAASLTELRTLIPEDGSGAGTFTGNAAKIGNELLRIAGTMTTAHGTLSTAQSSVNLGTVEQAVATIKGDLLDRGGDQVVAGIDQVGAGVAQAKSIVAAYLTEAAAEIQAAAAAGKTELNAAIVHLRAEIAGLKAAMATSPFPYGGDASQLPEGTVLAGAYEFRIDAADTNHPYTLPRILIGLIAMIAAGFAGKALAGRRNDTGGATAVDDTYTVTT